MQQYLKVIAEGKTLTEEQAENAMHALMRGEAEQVEAAAFLMGLRARGETLTELTSFTRIMRHYAVPVSLDDPHAIDLCGTGGDNTGTFNISTAAMFVCNGAGVTVAKHGNRSVSSRSGSADVLEALGVNVELRQKGVEYCLREAGAAFIFAPYFHPAMRFVMPVRKQLGARTFFNILGPLSNPAQVRRQLVGAFSKDMARMMAGILARLDAAHVIAVHSSDGMDEISLSDRTYAFEYRESKNADSGDPLPVNDEILPESFRLGRVDMSKLKGGSAEENAEIIRAVLSGQKGPQRDVVLLNAAFGLHTSGRFPDLNECFLAAADSIDSGKAKKSLERLIEVSHAARQNDDG